MIIATLGESAHLLGLNNHGLFTPHRVAYHIGYFNGDDLKRYLSIFVSDGRASKFIYAECPVIKYRGGTVVLYPLVKYQPEVKQLHGKKVHVMIIAEE